MNEREREREREQRVSKCADAQCSKELCRYILYSKLLQVEVARSQTTKGIWSCLLQARDVMT